jgi:hypothetical protein
MAWVTVPGSDSIWQFDNAATASDTYSDANGTTASGVRSFTRPSGVTEQTYVKCRKTGETIERGELSKTYYDSKV